MPQWKLLLIALAWILPMSWGYASERVYLGMNIGEPISTLDAEKMGVFDADVRTYTFGGRVFLGVHVTEELSAEAGYWILQPIEVPSINHVPIFGQIKQQFWDVAAKASWPLPHHYQVYGKVGAGTYTLNPDQLVRPFSHTDFRNERMRHIRPFGALGAGYDFNPEWATDVNIQHTVSHRAFSSLNAIFVGIIYHPKFNLH